MSYEFESMSYAQMINNARESLDFGTKEAYEESELNEYFSFSDDLESYDDLESSDLDDDEDFEFDSTEFEYYFNNDFDDLDDDYEDEEIF